MRNRGSQPVIDVGILKAERVLFRLDGEYVAGDTGEGRKDRSLTGIFEASVSEGKVVVRKEGSAIPGSGELLLHPFVTSSRFAIMDVVIGVGFHWEQREEQLFQGALKLIVLDDRVQVINRIPVESYLESVISSEMRADSHPELLRAHAIISRSWLVAQVEKQSQIRYGTKAYEMIHETKDEYIRWYDREDHREFHVCADDHCQRYQGITRANRPEVVRAVRDTAGEVLKYAGKICDARFSKCCGGVSELFENNWEPLPHPYLRRVEDVPPDSPRVFPDLKTESNAREFILESPEAFCNTRDERLLLQVLNDYDLVSRDFFRWKVRYSQEELSGLIREKSGIDFGEILDLVPVERGESSRLVRLKIIGSRQTLTVGKELEIRRWLSRSHLYSSAFIVERTEIREGIPGGFVLHGAGWGHGVGLCQIGAAVMAARGYACHEILMHYFPGATIEQPYA
jgi:stage II sporulation protein D